MSDTGSEWQKMVQITRGEGELRHRSLFKVARTRKAAFVKSIIANTIYSLLIVVGVAAMIAPFAIIGRNGQSKQRQLEADAAELDRRTRESAAINRIPAFKAAREAFPEFNFSPFLELEVSLANIENMATTDRLTESWEAAKSAVARSLTTVRDQMAEEESAGLRAQLSVYLVSVQNRSKRAFAATFQARGEESRRLDRQNEKLRSVLEDISREDPEGFNEALRRSGY